MLKMIERANTSWSVRCWWQFFLFVLDFATKANIFRKKALCDDLTDWDEQAAAVKNLDWTGFSFIFVSYTGETKGILAYARVAQEQQVPMISLISTKGSTLEKLSTTTLFCQSGSATRYHQRVDLRFKNCCHLFVRYGFINVCRGKAAAVILCNTILNDVRDTERV